MGLRIMQRREFIGLIGYGGVATGICADQERFAGNRAFAAAKSDTTFAKDGITALRKGLQEAGFIEGANYSLTLRFAEGNLSRYLEFAKELSALNARVIVAAQA
jgi:hypothetical protein